MQKYICYLVIHAFVAFISSLSLYVFNVCILPEIITERIINRIHTAIIHKFQYNITLFNYLIISNVLNISNI